ncbi:hypothetical protein SGLAM104S_07592 [Streptomyces glaucescens]
MALAVTCQAESVRATRSDAVKIQAVGRVDGVEDPAAEDEAELFDSDHQRQPRGAGLCEGEADGPQCAQCPGREQDAVLPEPGGEGAGQQ